jgi:hypothetical protein
MSIARALTLSLPFAAACSTTPVVGPEPTVLWEDAREAESTSKQALSPQEARRIAVAHDAAHTCEITARSMAKRAPERGWQVMRECIRRSDFSDLEILIEGQWAEELNQEPDAASLLAHVIAVRGGDVGADLRLLRRRKVPVYSLAAAMSEPEAYAGRTVLLRGNARSKRNGGKRAFRLVETKVMAESEWVTAPGTTRLSTESTGEAAPDDGVNVKRGTTQKDRRVQGEKVEVLHNVNVETGLEMVAHAEAGEPLDPAVDYVFVVRFDGVKDVVDENGEGDEEASGVILGYFEPESGMFARLGR